MAYTVLLRLSKRQLQWMLLFFSLFLVSCLISCSTFTVKNPQKEAEQIYRKDLKIKVDGKTFFGTSVLPRKPSYEFTIYPDGNIDRIIIQTCHRDYTVDKPKTGWFTDSYTFSFAPVPGIEDNRSCPMEIASLEEKKTRNGFAFIDFQDVREEISLQASMKCNGKESTVKGVGICQAGAGLRQSITFTTPVTQQSPPAGCEALETKDNLRFDWIMIPNKCVYYFVAKEKHKNGNRLSFRLNSLGFTIVPVR